MRIYTTKTTVGRSNMKTDKIKIRTRGTLRNWNQKYNKKGTDVNTKCYIRFAWQQIKMLELLNLDNNKKNLYVALQ